MMNNSTSHPTSVNSTATSVQKKYVFMTQDAFIAKLALFSPVAALGMYAVIANSLILHFKRRQRRNVKKRRAFDRFPVVSTYVQSLALSDLLCAIIVVPLAIIINFWDIINTDMACKVVRFTNLFFPVVTTCNLFVIGIERYLAVFYPLKVPSKRIVRGLVLSAWVFGGLMTLVPSATFRMQKRDIDSHSFTKLCIYDKTVPLYKMMFIGFTVIMYVLPSVILTFTSLRMLIFLRQRRKVTFPKSRNRNSSRFYGSFTFVALILTFVLPYFLYLLFSFLNIMLKFNLNYTAELIVRRLGGLLAYSNSAVSPSLMLFNMPDLRRDLITLIRKYKCFSPIVETNSNAVTGQDHNDNHSFPVKSTENRVEVEKANMEEGNLNWETRQ